MFIDSHSHLTSDQLYPHVNDILSRAKMARLDAIVNICTDHSSLERSRQLKQNYPWIYQAAATTPHDVESEGEEFFPEVVLAAKNKELVAIGETGLDYFYEHSNKNIQKKFLSKYFSLAIENKLPVIFHCRNAFHDLFAISDDEYKNFPALLHCFTGNLEEARAVLDRGWLLSLSGIVTFKKSHELQEIAKYVPLDRLLIETDAPYLAPQSKRGKVNEPAFIQETATFIASIKNITLEELATATSTNARKFFSF